VSISSTFYSHLFANIFVTKITMPKVTREKLHEALLFQKFAQNFKMLMNLTLEGDQTPVLVNQFKLV